ncbi:MAG: DUF1801 domain-containing protein [bacterium]|nr:DUF1801 domain-containing protein [bacterium]
MDQNEQPNESAAEPNGAQSSDASQTTDGSAKKKRRRRRGKKRGIPNDASGQSTTADQDDINDPNDSDDDDADGVDDSDDEGSASADGTDASSDDTPGVEPARKKKRRRKKKKSSREGAEEGAIEADGTTVESVTHTQEISPKEPQPQDRRQQDGRQQGGRSRDGRSQEPRQQEPRQQEPRQQEPRQQEPRQQEPRQQEPRQQEPRQQEPRQQEPRQQDGRPQRGQKQRPEPGSRGSVLQRRLDRIERDEPRSQAEQVEVVAPPPANVTSVDSYINHLRGWQREVVTTIRSLVRASSPEVEESIKWSQPVYEHNGPVCYVKAFSDHVNFGFWRGTELDDPENLLVGDLTKMRHVRIGHVNDIKRDTFERYVRQAVRLNRDKGDPTNS